MRRLFVKAHTFGMLEIVFDQNTVDADQIRDDVQYETQEGANHEHDAE